MVASASIRRSREGAPIPVNIVTGHLGAGKTSAIKRLLKACPRGRRWAVIVNEFGELGVDGEILSREDPSLLLREVSGSCICCGMGAPLLYVLEGLLERECLDRLLIEPTGLAEPTALIDSIAAPSVRDRLIRMATLTLMDLRAAARERMAARATVQRQIHAADVLIGTFADEATAADFAAFEALCAAFDPAKSLTATVAHGRVEVGWLDLEPVRSPERSRGHEAGAVTRGWRFPHSERFDRAAVDRVLRRVAPLVLRAKGILRTPHGWRRADIDAAGSVRWRTVPDGRDSRFELIAAPESRLDVDEVEAALRAARCPR